MFKCIDDKSRADRSSRTGQFGWASQATAVVPTTEAAVAAAWAVQPQAQGHSKLLLVALFGAVGGVGGQLMLSEPSFGRKHLVIPGNTDNH